MAFQLTSRVGSSPLSTLLRKNITTCAGAAPFATSGSPATIWPGRDGPLGETVPSICEPRYTERSQRRYNKVEQRRGYHTTSPLRALNNNTGLLGINNSNTPSSYFQRPSLPANTIIRFVPQQTAWIVERMGKFNRILQPGLAVLWPFLDRIAYVKSLKEAAIEIPSQSAITADNVTLELDGVLYTRVFDAYKAR